MYKVAIATKNGGKFLNSKPFYGKAEAEIFKTMCEELFEDEKFAIVEYCDRCEKKKPSFMRGICKQCYDRLQRQSPCYDCKKDYDHGACATCWVTRYIIGRQVKT